MKEPKDKRTKAYKEWKANFDKENSIGLGDLVERFTEETKIKKKVKYIFGEDCGCNKRKERLNSIRFRFKPDRCFTEDQFNRWTEFRKHKGNLTPIQVRLIHEIYEQLFARVFKPQSCCYESFINEINQVYETYENTK